MLCLQDNPISWDFLLLDLKALDELHQGDAFDFGLKVFRFLY